MSILDRLEKLRKDKGINKSQFEKKIDKAKEEIAVLKERLKMIRDARD